MEVVSIDSIEVNDEIHSENNNNIVNLTDENYALYGNSSEKNYIKEINSKFN